VRLIGILRLTHFRPRLTFSAHLLRPHLVFARDTLFVALVAVTQAQWAVIAVGRILGPVPLGVFSMSQRFSRLPQLGLAGPMSSVVYVRMAKNLHDPAGIARIYLAAMHVLAAAMLTPLAMIAVAGDSIFSLFLGDEWRPVAPIFALSIPGLALEAVAMVCLSCLFRAMGRTDLQVRFALESGALRIAMVSVAVFGGLKLMAFSLTLWGLAMVPRGWHLAARTACTGRWPACVVVASRDRRGDGRSAAGHRRAGRSGALGRCWSGDHYQPYRGQSDIFGRQTGAKSLCRRVSLMCLSVWMNAAEQRQEP
jgi:O-antigen/teichoic acid export membrane protein